jgi:hypothetical protein
VIAIPGIAQQAVQEPGMLALCQSLGVSGVANAVALRCGLRAVNELVEQQSGRFDDHFELFAARSLKISAAGLPRAANIGTGEVILAP